MGATGFKQGCMGAKQEDLKRTQGTRNGVRTCESAVRLVFLMRFRDYCAGLYQQNSVQLMTSCTGSCTSDLGRSAHRVASLCRLELNWLSSKRLCRSSRPGCVFLTFVFAHLNTRVVLKYRNAIMLPSNNDLNAEQEFRTTKWRIVDGVEQEACKSGIRRLRLVQLHTAGD